MHGIPTLFKRWSHFDLFLCSFEVYCHSVEAKDIWNFMILLNFFGGGGSFAEVHAEPIDLVVKISFWA